MFRCTRFKKLLTFKKYLCKIYNMNTILNGIKKSISAPFRKGIIYGILDILFRLVAIFLWVITAKVLFSFIWEAIFVLNVSTERVWWIIYSLMSLLMLTLLAYTAVYDRE